MGLRLFKSFNPIFFKVSCITVNFNSKKKYLSQSLKRPLKVLILFQFLGYFQILKGFIPQFLNDF